MFSGGLINILSMFLIGTGCIAPLLFAFACMRARKISQRERFAVVSLEQVIENLGEGFYRAGLDGKQLSANPALVAIHGHKSEREFIESVNEIGVECYVDPNRWDEFKQILHERGKVQNFVSEIYRHKTREPIWISENARLVIDPITGEPLYYEGTVNEATEIVARMQEKEKLQKLTSHVPGGLFQLVRDAIGTFAVVFASSGFNEMLDSDSASQTFDINHFISLIHPEDLNPYYDSLKISRKTGSVWSQDFRVVTDLGKTKWLQVQGTPETMPDGSTIWHGYLQDISATKAGEAQIKSLAYSDQLTKLPNRRALIDQLNLSVANNMRTREFSAVLFIDLDNFKAINDQFGHDVGDQLLLEVSKKLRQVVRRSDMVARLGGDEFVVLLDGLGEKKVDAVKKINAILESILMSFRTPIALGAITHMACASIGAVTFSNEGHSADGILRMADTAMYEVKKSGRNAFRVFEKASDPATDFESQILSGLQNLASSEELELCFQPQLDRDGKICGAEGLLRWNHPKLGVLTPDRFMPVAHLAGLSSAIDLWVVGKAIETLGRWKLDDKMAAISLAINAMAQQFIDDHIVERLQDLATLHGANLSNLKLEFTDKIISANREQSLTVMHDLKAIDVVLSLADFGVNFTSLAHLSEMPLDEIKIDGDFVKSVSRRQKDKALVRSIVAMADALGLATVAEHVETPAQERLLMEYGCNLFQGFLYGGAMKQADFEQAVLHNFAASADQENLRQVA